MMKIKHIFENILYCQIVGSPETVITGLTANSKEVKKGYLFIAKKGATFDGSDYIQDAIQQGAAAVLTQNSQITLSNDITLIFNPCVTQIESQVSANFYDHPSEKLFLVGITGTNGKTTTSFVVKYLLDHFLGPCGLIGTIENIIGKTRYKSTHTTPDVTTNHRLLNEMCQEECRSAVMEVTSHALDQRRVDQIDFDVAVFTNLTQDHLDYHETMEKYFSSKMQLFQKLGAIPNSKTNKKWAVINLDSDWSERMIESCDENILTYGINNPNADLNVMHLSFDTDGTHVHLAYQGEQVECWWQLTGRFNAYNCLAAIGVLLTQQIPLNDIVKVMEEIPSVPGRLQSVSNFHGLNVYVDYAHTDDALIKVLDTLKEVKSKDGRILIVFGCGGGRDRSKRTKMAQAAQEGADYCIVTSDNPRNENPMQICEDISKGFSRMNSYEIEIDRKKAIHRALSIAQKEDIVLIAGKGHETYQIFADRVIEFDDCQIVKNFEKALIH